MSAEYESQFLLTPEQRREALRRLSESDHPIAKATLEEIDRLLLKEDEDDEQ